jgi:SAM-dependent methyltransferase
MADASSMPSLQTLIESEEFGVRVLHPGGLLLTKELAILAGVARGTRVLDVACGSGAAACYLAQEMGAVVSGVDRSHVLVDRASARAGELGVPATFWEADAHDLPFPDGAFDAVLTECTLSLLDKPRALHEMVRVARPGGFVGGHDVCWRRPPTRVVARELQRLEGVVPETMEGLRALLGRAGLTGVEAFDRSYHLAEWMDEMHRALGPGGELLRARATVRAWGWDGLRGALASERVYRSPVMGYCLFGGRKPGPPPG